MPTILLPPRHSADTQELWRAAIRANWNIIRLQRWEVPPELPEGDVVLYSGFALAIAAEMKIALIEPPLDWLPSVPMEFLKRKIRYTTLGKARSCAERAFIKPADGKSFSARVYESGRELLEPGILHEGTAALVSDPVRFASEFRCFVLDGRVMTLSVYARNGALAETEEGWPASDQELEEAEVFANKVLAHPAVKLPAGVVLDVGVIEGQGLAVIESNCAWGAGIYDCDANEVLKVLARACVPYAKVTEADKPFIINREDGPPA